MAAKKIRREKTTVASEQSKILAAAFTIIKPPAHIKLQQDDLPFFESIIEEMANSEWTNHSIEVACFLARDMASLEREQRLLRTEGSLKRTKTNYPITNPRKSMIQFYTASILAYRRSLCLHIRAQGVNSQDIAKRKANAKEVQGLAEDFDDDLIARPGKVN